MSTTWQELARKLDLRRACEEILKLRSQLEAVTKELEEKCQYLEKLNEHSHALSEELAMVTQDRDLEASNARAFSEGSAEWEDRALNAEKELAQVTKERDEAQGWRRIAEQHCRNEEYFKKERDEARASNAALRAALLDTLSHLPLDKSGYACNFCDMGDSGYSSAGKNTHDDVYPHVCPFIGINKALSQTPDTSLPVIRQAISFIELGKSIDGDGEGCKSLNVDKALAALKARFGGHDE